MPASCGMGGTWVPRQGPLTACLRDVSPDQRFGGNARSGARTGLVPRPPVPSRTAESAPRVARVIHGAGFLLVVLALLVWLAFGLPALVGG